MKRIPRRPSPALVVAHLALFVALSGVGYAAPVGSITGTEIRNNTVSTDDVKDGSLQAGDAQRDAFGGVVIREEKLDAGKLDVSRLPRVPAARTARSARDVSRNAIDTTDLARNAVTDPDVGPRAVGSDELDDTVRRFGRNVQVPTGQTGVAKISCRREEQLLSGGGRWGRPQLASLAIQSSFSAGKNWTAIGTNNSGATQGFQAFALCLRR